MSRDSVRYGRAPKRSKSKSVNEKRQPYYIESSLKIQNRKMYDLIRKIADAYRHHCLYTEDNTRHHERKPLSFNRADINALEGQLGANNHELQKIVVFQEFSFCITDCISSIVEFAKQIPAFQDLSQDDQLRAIKSGFFEVWLIHAARLINFREGTVTFSNGTYMSRQQLEIVFDQEFVTRVFNFSCWFNELHLSEIEIALYSAIVLLNPERSNYFDIKNLQLLQEKLIEALEYQWSQDHPGEQHTYLSLMSRLPELKMLGEQNFEHLRWFRSRWRHLHIPGLFAEVFDIPKRDDHFSRNLRNEQG